ncbi:hypothetical protein ACFLR1_07035 [Bacteroidota bacterium]
MDLLQNLITTHDADANDVFAVIFEINNNGDPIFRFVNQTFVEFHQALDLPLSKEDLLGTTMQLYFKKHLRFTNEEIESRKQTFNRAISTKQPYHYKEVSELPGLPVMILDSSWTPVFHEGATFVVWKSKEYKPKDSNSK